MVRGMRKFCEPGRKESLSEFTDSAESPIQTQTSVLTVPDDSSHCRLPLLTLFHLDTGLLARENARQSVCDDVHQEGGTASQV
jgi:hypothetical protein